MKLREIMTAPVLKLGAGEPASDALAWMRDAKVRHLPVVSGGDLVGIVSDRDLGGPLGGIARKSRTVGDLMRRDPVVASPALGVREAASLMRTHRIGCLPVMEKGELVGIVTRSDLLMALAHLRRRDRDPLANDAAEIPRPPHLSSPNRDKWP
jgi:acetoin utilization protein AcuB